MYFKQADIFWGMSKDFIGQIMKVATTESYEEKELLFRERSPADHFYILLKGRVKLSIGEAGQVVYIVSKSGEAFGWSSLISRDVYSASAECLNPTKLLKFNRETLQEILEKDKDNALVLFKRLALILGNRLLQSYKMISSASQTDVSTAYGTGQVQAAEVSE